MAVQPADRVMQILTVVCKGEGTASTAVLPWCMGQHFAIDGTICLPLMGPPGVASGAPGRAAAVFAA